MKIVFLYAFYFSSIGTISHSRAAKQGMLRRRQVPFDVTEEDDHEVCNKSLLVKLLRLSPPT